MKTILMLVTFFAAGFASAMTYNPAVKHFPGGKKPRHIAAASANKSDADCIKSAESFAKASYEAILGKGKVSNVVWLSSGNALDANEKQLSDKWVVQVAVTSKIAEAQAKAKKEDPSPDYVADIFMDAKCTPAIARYYDVNSEEWKDSDSSTWR